MKTYSLPEFNNKQINYPGLYKQAKHIASIPFIWMLLVPGVLLHLFVLIFQSVCFRLYGIERVYLRSYVVFDREKLTYLNLLDKVNCAYCSYMNGMFAYVSEVGKRTEYYWCGVKHKNQPENPAFAYQDNFAAYGSKEEYDRVMSDSGRRV